MTAAAITATTVQKYEIPTTVVSGSAERKLRGLYLEGPKQAGGGDWFLLTSYISAAESANIAQIYSTYDLETGGANICTLDTWTYTSADAKLILTASTAVSVARTRVLYWEE